MKRFLWTPIRTWFLSCTLTMTHQSKVNLSPAAHHPMKCKSKCTFCKMAHSTLSPCLVCFICNELLDYMSVKVNLVNHDWLKMNVSFVCLLFLTDFVNITLPDSESRLFDAAKLKRLLPPPSVKLTCTALIKIDGLLRNTGERRWAGWLIPMQVVRCVSTSRLRKAPRRPAARLMCFSGFARRNSVCLSVWWPLPVT